MVDYIYGTVVIGGEEREYLKTKGDAHTDLTGYINTVREFDDATITDSCMIDRKYKTAEDDEGNCYDWYLIRDHYRMIDKTKPLKAENAQARADIDFIAMETGVEL